MRYMKKAVLVIFLSICTALCLCSCETAPKTSKKNYVTIGRICPMTGEFAEYAEGTLETEKAAVEELNQSGGIFIDALEKKLMVRYLLRDSGSTERGAKEAALQLVEEENVDVIIVSHSDSTVLPVAEICEEKQVPCFCVDADETLWEAQGKHTYSFLVSAGTQEQMDAFLPIWQEKGITSLVILTDQDSSENSFAGKTLKYCAENRITAKEVQLSDDYVKALRDAKADALLCVLDTDDYLNAKRMIHDAGLEMKSSMLVNEHLYYDALEKDPLSSAFDQTYTAEAWAPSFSFTSSLTKQDGKDLADWWNSEYITPCPESLGYKHGIVEVTVETLKRAMAVDADSIVKAAEELNLDTVLGTVHFDQDHFAAVSCVASQWIYEPHSVDKSKWSQILVIEDTDN